MRHDAAAFSRAKGAYARSAYEGTQSDMIRRYLPMVKRLAWHTYGGGVSSIEVDDLIQAGLVALTECVQRHQGQGEHAFSAYAKTRVRGAMIDLIRKDAPTTRAATRKRREIAGEQNKLAAMLGRQPSEGEIAEALGIDLAEYSAMLASSAPARFEPIDDAYNDNQLAFADDSPDAHAVLEDSEVHENLAAAIGALPQRLQLITQLYFVDELNLSEIAQVLEVSVPRVHQLKAQALDALRAALGPDISVL